MTSLSPHVWWPSRLHDRLASAWRWILHALWSSHRLLGHIVVLVLLALIALRLALPYALLALANHQLARPGPVQGHIDGLSLSLWRGHYDISGLRITILGADGLHYDPLLDVATIGCTVHMTRLLAGRYEGAIILRHPELHLGPPAKDAAKRTDQPSSEAEWQAILRGLVTFRIAALAVDDGRIAYDDSGRDVHAIIGLITGRIDDLITPATRQEPATFTFNGTTPGGGALAVSGQASPEAAPPRLEMTAVLEHLDLTAISPITEHYDGLRFDSGTFSGYLRYRLDGVRIDGAFKFIFHHLSVSSYAAKAGAGATRLFWSVVVPVAEYVLKNGEKDQQAAIIPITGRIADPHSDMWTVAGSALSNAFIRALAPGFAGLQGEAAPAQR